MDSKQLPLTRIYPIIINENNETLPYTPPLPTDAVYYTPQEVINEIELKSIIGNPPYNDKKKDKDKRGLLAGGQQK